MGYEFEQLLCFLGDSGFDWKLSRKGFEATLGDFRWAYDFAGAWITTATLRQISDRLRSEFDQHARRAPCT